MTWVSRIPLTASPSSITGHTRIPLNLRMASPRSNFGATTAGAPGHEIANVTTK